MTPEERIEWLESNGYHETGHLSLEYKIRGEKLNWPFLLGPSHTTNHDRSILYDDRRDMERFEFLTLYLKDPAPGITAEKFYSRVLLAVQSLDIVETCNALWRMPEDRRIGFFAFGEIQ